MPEATRDRGLAYDVREGGSPGGAYVCIDLTGTWSLARRAPSAARHRVVLVSDGRGSSGVLDAEPDEECELEVVTRAHSLSDALLAASEQPVEAVLLDVPLTVACRADILAASASLPGVRFVAIGVAGIEEAMAWAEAGVAGFVEAGASVRELAAVLDSARHGELRCSPEVGTALPRRVRELGRDWTEIQLAQLTARELEILHLVGEGLSNAEIAERTGLRLPTVKNHVRSLMRKLRARTRAAAAAAVRGRARSTIPPAPSR